MIKYLRSQRWIRAIMGIWKLSGVVLVASRAAQNHRSQHCHLYRREEKVLHCLSGLKGCANIFAFLKNSTIFVLEWVTKLTIIFYSDVL